MINAFYVQYTIYMINALPNIGQHVFSDGQNHILNPYQRQYLVHNISKSKSG